jgi:hypothetical protein
MLGKNEFEHMEQDFINESWNALRYRLDEKMPLYSTGPAPRSKWLVLALFLNLAWLTVMSYLYFRSIPYAPATRHSIEYKTKYLIQNQPTAKAFAGSDDRESSNLGITAAQFGIPANIVSSSDAFQNDHAAVEYASPSNLVHDQIDNAELISSDLYSIQYRTSHTTPSLYALSKLNIENRKAISALSFSLSSFISNLNYTGYGLGFGLNFPVKGRINLETGIHLNFISKSYYFLPFFERSVPDNFKANSNINLQDADTFHSGLKSFNQVVLPLALSYSINRRLALSTGVRFRYTYSKNIDETLQSKAQRKIERNKSVEETFFNASNLGIYSGLSYNVTPHINLRLDAELGLGSLISNQAISDPYFRPYDLNLLNLSAQFKF